MNLICFILVRHTNNYKDKNNTVQCDYLSFIT